MAKKQKIKILAVPANSGGCAYYRIIMPMQKLAEKFPDEVELRMTENPLGVQKVQDEKGERLEPPPPDFVAEDLDWCDIMFTQNISNYGGQYTMQLIGQAKEKGKFVHYDTDDLLTNLYEGHRLYATYKEQKLSEITKWYYHNADLVTVTQRKFAERIAPYCQNTLAVIRNAIDYDLQNWNHPKVPAHKKNYCRLGWVGGIHHEEDVKEFRSVAMGVNAKRGHENIHWGFYGRPPLAPGEKGDWQQDVWDNYQRYMTRGVHPRHRNFEIYHALPGDQYGVRFTHMDACIAPLQYNEFNDSKSEIKVMEAGRYGLPLIASDVGCYSDVIVNGETGYLIPRDNPREMWVKTLTRVAKDKKHREEMGRNLKQITDEAYDINKIINGRLELYQELLDLRDKVRENENTTS